MPMALSIKTQHGMPTYEIIMATKTMEKHYGKQDNNVKIISSPTFFQIVGKKIVPYGTRGVSQHGLAIYIKKYVKAKEELWKLKSFIMQKYT